MGNLLSIIQHLYSLQNAVLPNFPESSYSPAIALSFKGVKNLWKLHDKVDYVIKIQFTHAVMNVMWRLCLNFNPSALN